MLPDTQLIKCPNCGAILQIKNVPGIEKANVTCTICKERSIVGKCKIFSDNKQSEDTNIGAARSKEHTKYRQPNIHNIGVLRVLDSSNAVFQLKPGRNIIGRKATASKADIQLLAGLRMSREHLIIDVQGDSNIGYTHRVSLFKEQVNATFIGNIRLEYGDCLILHNGDMIKLPDLNLTIEIN